MSHEELVKVVKDFQRKGEEYKQLWYSFVTAKGSPNYDPNRHDTYMLKEFLAQAEAGTIVVDESIRQGAHLNATETAKAQLVMQVKAFQRMGEEYKQKWYSFLHLKGSIHYDPNRQDISTLKEFLVKYDVATATAPKGKGKGKQLSMNWTCASCGDLQFGRNKECRMCGTERPLLPEPGAAELWTCTACWDAQPAENTQCRMCGEPHYSENPTDYAATAQYMAAYMAMAGMMQAAAESGDMTAILGADGALPSSGSAEETGPMDLMHATWKPPPSTLPAALTDGTVDASALLMDGAELQPAANAFGWPMEGSSPGMNAPTEQFEESFGKRPLSMQQYDSAFTMPIPVPVPEPEVPVAAVAAEAPSTTSDAPNRDDRERDGSRGRRRDRSRSRRDRRSDRSRSRRRGDRDADDRGEASSRKRRSKWDEPGLPPGQMDIDISAPPQPAPQSFSYGGGMGPPPRPGMGMGAGQSSHPMQGGFVANVGQGGKGGPREWASGFRDPNNPEKKPPGRPGDWICASCHNVNFASRKVCHNDKCKASPAGAERIGLKPGDWICPTCGDLVFASKAACKMCKTPKQAPKPGEEASGGKGGDGKSGQTYGKSGDWTCSKCGDYQYARNTHCRLCNNPKDPAFTVPTKVVGNWQCGNVSCNQVQSLDNTVCQVCGDPQSNGKKAPTAPTQLEQLQKAYMMNWNQGADYSTEPAAPSAAPSAAPALAPVKRAPAAPFNPALMNWNQQAPAVPAQAPAAPAQQQNAGGDDGWGQSGGWSSWKQKSWPSSGSNDQSV